MKYPIPFPLNKFYDRHNSTDIKQTTAFHWLSAFLLVKILMLRLSGLNYFAKAQRRKSNYIYIILNFTFPRANFCGDILKSKFYARGYKYRTKKIIPVIVEVNRFIFISLLNE